ncbi:PQQ-binding-like beta-propeller repeat protein [Planctomicrobium sp. SH668]|uniref:outer membrane protein assembly factor BamB family protein n=1 Tax=Planctomicrobium sp. SH668 TaxID=3448126 RepID=UPI003F5C4FC2
MRRKLLTAGVAAMLFSAPLLAEDWPQWRGKDRDAKAVDPGLKLDWEKKAPEHLWTIDGMGQGYASMSIVNDRLYTTGNTAEGQKVVCVDLPSQKVVWSTPMTSKAPEHGYEGSRCTPTIDGDRLYAVASDGQIFCMNTEDGNVIWKHSFESEWDGKMMSVWGFSESPLVDGDRVVCTPGGDQAMMVALDKMSGDVIWKSPFSYNGERGKDGAGYSSIVISNAAGVKQYVQLIGRGLIGVQASDGKFLWVYDKVANDVANIPTPICFGNFVFASSGYGTGAALLKISKVRNVVKAEEEYFLDAKTFQNHHGGMVQFGDFIYTGHQHNKGFPLCLHVPSGKVRWGGNIRPVGDGSAAITAVNDQLIFRYQDGTLALINATPKAYQLKGTFKPEYQERESWSHPVVVNGKLYLREQDKLMCYQL